MPKRLMYVEYGDTERLCDSNKGGDHSPLTRDLDGKLHHVVLHEVDEDELFAEASSPPSYTAPDAPPEEPVDYAAMLENLVNLAILAIAAKPHVERWWNDQARPAISSAKRSTKERINKVRRRKSTPATTEVAVVESVTEERPRQSMTEDEARRRLVAAVAARVFSDEQLRILQEADIAEEEFAALKASVEQLSTAEIAAEVHLMLEASPALYDEIAMLLAARQVAAPAKLLSSVAAEPLRSVSV